MHTMHEDIILAHRSISVQHSMIDVCSHLNQNMRIVIQNGVCLFCIDPFQVHVLKL